MRSVALLCAGGSKSRLCAGETKTSKESYGRCRQDALGGTAEIEGTDDGTTAGEHRGRSRYKKVGPATRLMSDVTMLLELLRTHLASLSTHAMDVVARTEDDVKVVRMQDMRPMEGVHVEIPPRYQQTQPDVPGTCLRGIASQAQTLEAMRQAEGEDDRARRARDETTLNGGRMTPSRIPDRVRMRNRKTNMTKQWQPPQLLWNRPRLASWMTQP